MALFLGLVVALTYGTGDFFGGLAARRVPVLWVVFLSHALAAVLVVAVVGLDRNADPTRHDIVIGIVAGVIGMVSVALFYKGLALGRMESSRRSPRSSPRSSPSRGAWASVSDPAYSR